MLFSPLKIKNYTFKNRMVVSPMCMYQCEDGYANNFHLVHLGNYALAGYSMIIQEATAVSPEGRITWWDLGIWKDEHKAKLKEIVEFVHQHDALIGIQLAHAGRKASHLPPHMGRKEVRPDEEFGWQTVGPSAVPYHKEENPPIALDAAGIQKVKDDFMAAAERANEIGYDMLEIHAAHGYLLHQFLSPLSNFRTDEYGGSFENRIRLLMEVVEAVKTKWDKDKLLFVRISAVDWVENGWSIEDSIELSKRLKALGVDLIDTSSGGNYSVKVPVGPGYQAGFAKAIREHADVKTSAVGLITTAKQSEELLQSGHADLVMYARLALRDPFFPLKAAKEMGVEVEWPEMYERGLSG